MRELVPVPALYSNDSGSSGRGIVCLGLALGAHALLSFWHWEGGERPNPARWGCWRRTKNG